MRLANASRCEAAPVTGPLPQVDRRAGRRAACRSAEGTRTTSQTPSTARMTR
jgi:hypothetical protein